MVALLLYEHWKFNNIKGIQFNCCVCKCTLQYYYDVRIEKNRFNKIREKKSRIFAIHLNYYNLIITYFLERVQECLFWGCLGCT